MLLPLLVVGLLAGGYYAKTKHDKDPGRGKLTPERQVIFETALNDVEDSAKLRALGKAFHDAGLHDEGTLLEKRANLRDLAPEIKEQRREAYRLGMKSKDPVAVDNLASAFENDGATGAAKALREYAQALRIEYADQRPPKGANVAPIAAQ